MVTINMYINMYTRFAAVIAIISLLFVVTACGGAAETGGENQGNGNGAGGSSSAPIDADLAGASAGGFFQVLGETINGIVREEYPGSSISYIPGSPVGGLVQVANGERDLVIAVGPTEELLANAGEPPFEESLEGQFQSIMQIHEQQVYASVALESWAERYGIESWDDVAEKKPPMRIALNQQGNLQVVRTAEELFNQYGFTFEDIETWGGEIVWESSSTTLEQLQDRRVDVWFNASFSPIVQLQDISRAVPLTWISIGEEEAEATAERWGNLTETVTPEDYEFVAQEEPTIRQQADMLVSPDMPEEEVYKITKAIFESADRMKNIHPGMRDFSIEDGVKIKDRVPLHPGAERYYREAGVL